MAAPYVRGLIHRCDERCREWARDTRAVHCMLMRHDAATRHVRQRGWRGAAAWTGPTARARRPPGAACAPGPTPAAWHAHAPTPAGAMHAASGRSPVTPSAIAERCAMLHPRRRACVAATPPVRTHLGRVEAVVFESADVEHREAEERGAAELAGGGAGAQQQDADWHHNGDEEDDNQVVGKRLCVRGAHGRGAYSGAQPEQSGCCAAVSACPSRGGLAWATGRERVRGVQGGTRAWCVSPRRDIDRPRPRRRALCAGTMPPATSARALTAPVRRRRARGRSRRPSHRSR